MYRELNSLCINKTVTNLQGKENDQQRDSSPRVKRSTCNLVQIRPSIHRTRDTNTKKTNIVELGPPSKLISSQHILEHETQCEPRGVVDASRRWNELNTSDNKWDVDIFKSGARITSLPNIKGNRQECSDE